MRVLVVLILIFWHLSVVAQVTKLTGSVDKNTALIDESVEFTLVATGSANRADVDFSVLQNDFTVSRPSFSQSTQIINGSMTRTVSWTVRLFPLKTGKIEIPSFEIDGQRSDAFSIQILPASATSADAPRDYYLTAEVSQDQLYLQQQLLYTIKIYLSGQIQRGSLALPELEGAIIKQIGEDQDFEEIKDGIRYRVIKRDIAIIPQASGEVTIKGPIFEADVLTDSRRSFANFGRTKTISRRAPDVRINVLPIPDTYKHTWLPSELVEISEQWIGDSTLLTVGEPITRTITLNALGLTQEQLPAIQTTYHPSFKVYPEQPVLTTAEHKGSLIAQGVYNTAIIPSESGSFILPEVRIPWFNVATGQTEFALIPARSVEVQPQTNTALSQDEQSTQSSKDELVPSETPQQVVQTAQPAYLSWLIVALIISNVLTLLVLILVWRRQQSLPSSPTNNVLNTASTDDENTCYIALKRHLEQGSVEQSTDLLDRWLKALFKSQHFSISNSLARYNKGETLAAYNRLLAFQYNDSVNSVDFVALIASIEKFRTAAHNAQNVHVLDKLY